MALSLPWTLPTPIPQAAADAAARAHQLAHPVVAAILLGRGIAGDGISPYLAPDIATLHAPGALARIDDAAAAIDAAIGRGEKITVYGDYDVDGTTGAALLVSYLRSKGADADAYIPMRQDGYGLSVEAIEAIARERRPKLLLTVDCGTSSREEAALARSLGIEVVVTDHHRPVEGKITEGIVVNPHMAGDASPNKGIAGVAVGWKLVSALHGSHPTANMDLVAIGTVADVMPLTGENRPIVRAGLTRLAHTHRPGMAALLRVAGRGAVAEPCRHGASFCAVCGKGAVCAHEAPHCFRVTAESISFDIAPRINAIGRMGLDPNMVVELFLTGDRARADEIATLIDTTNSERKTQTQALTDEAIRRANPEDPVIVVQMDLFKGVAGLVAGRLASEFGRPAIVVDAEGHGSARSVKGIDLLRVLQDECADLVGAAGHAVAMGIKECADPAALAARLRLRAWPDTIAARSLTIDAVIRISDVTAPLVGAMEVMEPTGEANPAPLFAIGGLTVKRRKLMGAEGRHVRYTLADLTSGRTIEAIHFFGGPDALPEGTVVDVAGRPTLDTHPRFGTRLEWRVRAIRPHTAPLPPTLA